MKTKAITIFLVLMAVVTVLAISARVYHDIYQSPFNGRYGHVIAGEHLDRMGYVTNYGPFDLWMTLNVPHQHLPEKREWITVWRWQAEWWELAQ